MIVDLSGVWTANFLTLETDIYHFIRKLRLTYNFRDSTYEGKSIVKNESKFTPKDNENQELEIICKNLSETKINIKRILDSIPNLRDGLDSLMTKTRSNEIIIKPADKGSIVVVNVMWIFLGNVPITFE